MKYHEIRAQYDDNHITVYQAYNKAIADGAVSAQTFVSPFKKDRMTWIKPSFLWAMYRSGWATKENQECILKISIKREGFEWALNNACITPYERSLYNSKENWQLQLDKFPIRIQWDPERDIQMAALPYRSIQIGLDPTAVDKYVNDWIVRIENITDIVTQTHNFIKKGEIDNALKLLPSERPYPLPDLIKARIGIS